MKSATVLPAEPNGTYTPRRKRSGSRKGTPPPDVPEIAPFQETPAESVDTPMWPSHPLLWLEPALSPALPAWSGLSIERRHKTPAPGFAAVEPKASVEPARPESPSQPLPPVVARAIPRSDLTPLGWDPRALAAVRPKEEQA